MVRHRLSRFLSCDSHGRTQGHATRCCGKVLYKNIQYRGKPPGDEGRTPYDGKISGRVRQSFGSHVKKLNSALPLRCRAPCDARTIVTAPEILICNPEFINPICYLLIADYQFPNIGKLIACVQIQNIMSAHLRFTFQNHKCEEGAHRIKHMEFR